MTCEDYKEISLEYHNLTKQLIRSGITISTMESCTSGFIASLITDTEGASSIFKGSHVTYCNESKIQNGVPKAIIDTYGVYSKETAISMAKACKEGFGTDIGIGITGTFGNLDPNNAGSSCGEVFYAIDYNGQNACYSINIPAQNSRLNYKIAVAAALIKDLKGVIA